MMRGANGKNLFFAVVSVVKVTALNHAIADSALIKKRLLCANNYSRVSAIINEIEAMDNRYA